MIPVTLFFFFFFEEKNKEKLGDRFSMRLGENYCAIAFWLGPTALFMT